MSLEKGTPPVCNGLLPSLGLHWMRCLHLQGVEMARFGHAVLFPEQNVSVAIMQSKIDTFESFQVHCAAARAVLRLLSPAAYVAA